MKNSKLITLLKTFSKQEMKDFEKFILSPYFSPKRNLELLYSILRKFHPSFDSPHLKKEWIFAKLNPGKKYDKKKSGHALQVMVSEMTLLAEKFLAIENLQKAEEGYFLYNSLGVELKFRNLTNYYPKVTLKCIEILKKTDSIGLFFKEMMMMNEILKNMYKYMNKKHEAFKYAQRKALYVYGYMIMQLGMLVNEYLTSGEKHNKKPRFFELLENSVNAFDPEIFENECYDDGLGTKQQILIEYYLTKSELEYILMKSELCKGDKDGLITAIEYYKENFQNLRLTVKWNFFVGILNICLIRKREFDIKKYSLIGSELIDFVIGNGIIGLNEGMPMTLNAYTQFFSFKIIALDCGKLKNFIDTMLEKVQSEHKKWLYEYSYAWLSFKKGEYEKTLEFLSKFSNRDINIKNNATILKIASLYSLGYIEEAIYSLDSYEHFFRNNENVSGEIGDYVSLLTNSLRTLIKYRTGSSPVDNFELDKIIENNKNRNFHFWFKAEAEKLKISSL